MFVVVVFYIGLDRMYRIQRWEGPGIIHIRIIDFSNQYGVSRVLA